MEFVKESEKGFPQGCLVEALLDFKTNNVGQKHLIKTGDILKIVNIDQGDLFVYRINSPQWQTSSWIKTDDNLKYKLKRVRDQFLEDITHGIMSQYCEANNVWAKGMNRFREMEKDIAAPKWYLNLSENEKIVIQELVGNAEVENIDLENTFLFYTSATIKDARKFLRWWFHHKHGKQKKKNIGKKQKKQKLKKQEEEPNSFGEQSQEKIQKEKEKQKKLDEMIIKILERENRKMKIFSDVNKNPLNFVHSVTKVEVKLEKDPAPKIVDEPKDTFPVSGTMSVDIAGDVEEEVLEKMENVLAQSIAISLGCNQEQISISVDPDTDTATYIVKTNNPHAAEEMEKQIKSEYFNKNVNKALRENSEDLPEKIRRVLAVKDVNDRTCPGNHALNCFETNHGRYKCNDCLGKRQGIICHRPHKKGVPMHGCRICNYDLCQDCYEKVLDFSAGKKIIAIEDFVIDNAKSKLIEKINIGTIMVIQRVEKNGRLCVDLLDKSIWSTFQFIELEEFHKISIVENKKKQEKVHNIPKIKFYLPNRDSMFDLQNQDQPRPTQTNPD